MRVGFLGYIRVEVYRLRDVALGYCTETPSPEV